MGAANKCSSKQRRDVRSIGGVGSQGVTCRKGNRATERDRRSAGLQVAVQQTMRPTAVLRHRRQVMDLGGVQGRPQGWPIRRRQVGEETRLADRAGGGKTCRHSGKRGRGRGGLEPRQEGGGRCWKGPGPAAVPVVAGAIEGRPARLDLQVADRISVQGRRGEGGAGWLGGEEGERRRDVRRLR